MFVKIVLVLMIGLALLYPLIETVDFWDNFPQTGQDLELSVLGFLTLLGMALVIECCKLLFAAFRKTLISGFLFSFTANLPLSQNDTGDDALPFPPLVPLRI